MIYILFLGLACLIIFLHHDHLLKRSVIRFLITHSYFPHWTSCSRFHHSGRSTLLRHCAFKRHEVFVVHPSVETETAIV